MDSTMDNDIAYYSKGLIGFRTKTRMDDDRISQLPEAIAHHILSFLKDSPKALVRMSVLSKYWFAITASFPILDFDLHNFTRDMNEPRILNDFSSVKDMFFKYVEYTTSRFCNQQNVVTSVHNFKLSGMLLDNPTQLSIVDRCIGSLVKNGGLQVFHINIHIMDPLPKYYLPNILFSVSYLSSLIIQGCELPSSLMVDDAIIKLKSLKLLCLARVNINDQVIERLTTCFPLLEKFKLVDCHGFKRFRINGFQNLQKVSLEFDKEVERIDIDAPNLWRLFLVDRDHQGAPCMNLSSCKKLTTLSYHGNPLPKLLGCTDFLSNFPHIENLYLEIYHGRRNLKLSSHSLKTLVLNPCCDLDISDIYAPKLVLLKYSPIYKLSEFLVRKFDKSEAQMEFCPTVDGKALWFNKLRRFLKKTSGFHKVLKLYICSSVIDVEELKVIDSPPIELEHVEVELGRLQEFSVYVAAVDAVLWCLRPRSLTLKSNFQSIDFDQRSHVVKFIYEKLLQQEDEGRTGIQIEFSVSSSKATKQFNDLNSLLAALPRDPLRHIIILTKVEDSNTVKEA